MQDTSTDAYSDLKMSGGLHRAQQIVFSALKQFGPATANELFKQVQGTSEIVQANFHARLSELRNKGKVKINQKRACKITGRRVIEWATV